MKLVMVMAALFLTACQTLPNYETGEDFWRYGIQQEGNTGRMSPTPAHAVPVVKLGYADLLVACGQEDNRTLARQKMDGNTMLLRACYDPMTDTIYSYYLNLGEHNYFVEHERGHIYWGREHNACWNQGYGIGKDESACEWNRG